MANVTRRNTLALGGAALASAFMPAARAAENSEHHDISAFGDLKYPPDFRHFDYVNPNAPKGGTFSHVAPTLMFNQNLIARLGNAVHNVYALSTSGLAAPLLALIARTGEALGTFRLEDGTRQQVAELTVQTDSTVAGRTIADIRREQEAQVVARFTAGGQRTFIQEVDPEARAAPGERKHG